MIARLDRRYASSIVALPSAFSSSEKAPATADGSVASADTPCAAAAARGVFSTRRTLGAAGAADAAARPTRALPYKSRAWRMRYAQAQFQLVKCASRPPSGANRNTWQSRAAARHGAARLNSLPRWRSQIRHGASTPRRTMQDSISRRRGRFEACRQPSHRHGRRLRQRRRRFHGSPRASASSGPTLLPRGRGSNDARHRGALLAAAFRVGTDDPLGQAWMPRASCPPSASGPVGKVRRDLRLRRAAPTPD